MKFLVIILATILSVNAITFNCAFSEVFSTTLRFFSYSCFNPVLSNANESQIVTAVNGEHFGGRTNDDVLGLYLLFNYQLPFFPKGIEKFFPNLSFLIINTTTITTLNGDELMPFNKLEMFAFHRLNLERVPGNLFKSTPLMSRILLSNNNIKHVDENLFDGLEHLEVVDFRFNYCIDQRANNVDEIPSLLENLKASCTVSEKTTCGDMHETICHLEDQNVYLISSVQDLTSKNARITEKLQQLTEENSKIWLILNEILKGVLDLKNRPKLFERFAIDLSQRQND